ncbi:MAG: cell surface protein SprA [Bacteroidetes bacterium]|nr:cell surface protein SprA [Bacteroidota bacterium]
MQVRHRIYTGFLTLAAMSTMLLGYASTYHKLRLTEPAPAADPAPAAPLPDSPTLKYPMTDRQGDHVTDTKKDPFYLPDPANVKKDVEYDPVTGKYVVTEKVGDVDIKEPMYLTYEEYLKYTEKQERNDYFKSRSNAITLIEDKSIIPPINMKNKILDRLFGGTKIEVKPQGNLDLTLGGNYQKIDNPNIPIRNRHTGGFDFDMNINMNVVAKIGDKLQLGLKYNTQSGFDFNNQVKLGYTGKEDDIIKEIAIGNVNMTLPTRLINGSQSLFGFKTTLQFGRLTWTTIVSQQKSKTQTITVDNGAQRTNFELRADQYDENKHYFLAQHFRDQYDYALSNMPTIQSIVNITRLEVWVTNRNGTTTNVRDVVALADLGEKNPHNYPATANGSSNPDNSSNGLYGVVANNLNGRYVDHVENTMTSLGLTQGTDFEKTYARKLQPTEYTFSPNLGYLSLNTALNPNDVLAVAYQYEVNGQVYKVGEFSTDIPPDSNSVSKVIYLKLIKGTALRVNLPYYKLMMKNIYSLGAYQVSNEDFRLNIYYNDPGGGEKQYMPAGCLKGKQLIKVLNLDNLNTQGDAQPDGQFDFVSGVTIIPQNGRIIFPVLEPFGSDLQKAFTACGTSTQTSGQYTYQELYDSTKFNAQQFPEKNRFIIRGQYKGANGSQISLGGINIPKGSVKVSAGGTLLKEGVDYEVDYSLGRVTILNQGVLNSGQQVKIDFENNSQFGFQQKSLYGTRLDYLVTKKINVGATVMHMTERPFTQKVNIGEDPISNTIFGADIKYETNAPWLTKALDKLPVYSTKEMSTISGYAEVAHLSPGSQKSINNASGQAQVYVDDFEGTTTNYDLKNPLTNWRLASTPRNSPDASGRNLFPEADNVNNLQYGYNRSKFAWYRIDNTFYVNNPNITEPYQRIVSQKEIFPNKPNQLLDNNIYTFDLALYPLERGPYNYEQSNSATPGVSSGVNSDGSLKNPKSRWGGIMRALDNTDLESTNVEFIEFWMLDPFINNPSSQGGQLYINLGNVSEDVLKDSRLFMENGLNQDRSQVDRTAWGLVPKLLPLTTAFSSDQDRPYEDVGFDGFRDQDERDSLATFLTNCQSFLNPTAFAKLQNDPSSDDYTFFNDASLSSETDITKRYKNYNGPDGNTPVQSGNSLSNAGTSLPDNEDLNKDNSLNEDEEYFQYRVDLKPGMDVGTNKYIISKQSSGITAANGQTEMWYQFRVPIHDYDVQVGSLPDFKSIQFIRMFMTGWSDSSAILRLASLDLIRNQWRAYAYPIDPGSDNLPNDNSSDAYFNVGKVNIEENSGKTPVNYILPPNIDRTYAIGAQTNQYVQQNEQSLSLKVCGLDDGNSKAVFKNVGIDMRRYYHLNMYVHANRIEGEAPIKDGDVTAFVRLGTDFTANYYQYEIPVHVLSGSAERSNFNSDVPADRDSVWPPQNNVDVDLQYLVDLKIERNATNWPKTVPYKKYVNGRIYTIVGNPDLGSLKDVMLGIKNPAKGDTAYHNPYDDGQSKCAEVWFDELRLSGLDQHGGTAALGEVAIKLADLGRINLTGSMHTHGFGQIEQKIDQRYKDDLYQYSAAGNLDLGKLFPTKAGIRLPFFGNITQSFSLPEFDPYMNDVRSAQEITAMQKAGISSDSIKAYKRQIETINTRRGFNFTGVRIMPKLKSKVQRIYDPANFSFTYSYNEILLSDPFTELNKRKTHVGIVSWSFSPQAKEFTPLKRIIKARTKWLDILRDFNFNLMPATLSFNTDVNRDFNSIKLRNLGDVSDSIPTTYNKSFRWNRMYAFKYNPFKSLSIDYTATNQSRIDEYDGEVDTREKKDFIWNNFKKGGRNTNYAQNFAAAYTLPINKIPAFDFISANAGYASTYTWVAAPQVYDSATKFHTDNPLGNIISNTQNLRGKLDFNFKKIYDKVPFLKTYSQPNPNLGDKKENDKKREAVRKAREKIKEEIDKLIERRDKISQDLLALGNDKAMPDSVRHVRTKQLKAELKAVRKQIRAKRKSYREKQMPPDPIISILMRPLLSLKTGSVEYKETKGTTLAGFMPSTNVIGNNTKLAAPGYDFAFGGQPGDRLFGGIDTLAANKWLDRAAGKGWISSDTLLNTRFTQTKLTRLDIKAGFELFPDFKIDLSLFREYSENQSQFFKVVTPGDGWEHLNQMTIGSYTISYVPVRTFFDNIDARGFSQTYKDFENNRTIISQRLGAANPNSVGDYIDPTDSTHTRTNANYKYGYGPLQQDVLIASFLAAYNHQDAQKVNLNPFKSTPMPNWRITYNGLTKIKWMKKIFSNFTLSHGYSSTLTVSSFQTNLDAQYSNSHLSRVDSISNNFYSGLNMPSIVMNEQFSPLIGIDMTFVNKISARFDYKTSRTVTMTFADYQLIENKSTTITVGAGYIIKGLKVNFIKLKNGKPLRLDNDLKFKLDVSYRDGVTVNHRIDQTLPQITAGSSTLTISPAIDYMVNKNITVRLFCDYSHTNPRVLSSFPTTNVKGGIQLRMSLTQ